MSRHRSFGRLTMAASGVLLTLATAAHGQAAADAELDTAFSHLARSFDALESIEFQYTTIRTYPQGIEFISNGPLESVNRGFYAERGDRFRVEHMAQDLSSGEVHHDAASHDGQRYYEYNANHAALTVSSSGLSSSPPGGSPPPWLPFVFAFEPDTRRSTAALRDPQTWERLRQQARWVGETTFQGRPAVVIEIEQPDPTYIKLTRLTLARDLNYYPVHREQEDVKGRLVGTLTVESYQTFSGQGPLLVVPTGIRGSGYRRDGSLDSTSNTFIDSPSLRINHLIPDERFTIQPAHVSVLRDMDALTVTETRGDEVITRPLAPRRACTGWGWWWSLPGAAAIAAAAGLWWYMRQRRAYL